MRLGGAPRPESSRRLPAVEHDHDVGPHASGDSDVEVHQPSEQGWAWHGNQWRSCYRYRNAAGSLLPPVTGSPEGLFSVCMASGNQRRSCHRSRERASVTAPPQKLRPALPQSGGTHRRPSVGVSQMRSWSHWCAFVNFVREVPRFPETCLKIDF